MRRLLFLLALVAGCGTETKNHCEATADCIDGDQCIAGTCQGAGPEACGVEHDQCAADATCTNTGDALACTCAQGFTGDGLTCADVDECAMATSCAAHATCSNTPGSFACACAADYTGDGSYCVPAKFKKVAAAGGFSCALGEDGGIYCWGTNYYGDLGDGTTIARSRPTQVGNSTDWIDVGARTNEACGLRADHSLWCWGFGSSGQLGDGKRATSYSPVEVISDKPGLGWKMMSVGRSNMCAIHTDGSAACWGLDRVTGAMIDKPVAVDDNNDWTTISSGYTRCGLRNNGHLYCWGQGRYGELGLGDVTEQATPTQVGIETWRDVRVGYYNVCGITSAGALKCWGDNPIASLKYGKTPLAVGSATDWESVTVAAYSIVALRNGGKAYSWGDNDSGQLGQPLSIFVENPTPLGDPSTVWSQVSGGNLHGCGIASGQMYCWGEIGDGYLGDGQTTTWLAPTKLTDDKWTAIANGASGVRGVRSDGGLMASGLDLYDGVGFGNTAPVWAPARIGSDQWDAVFSAHDGMEVTCALRDGAPYCWGDNYTGQGGVGNIDSPQLSPTAVKVPAGSTWTELATGQHTCAIRSDGELFCWGNNEFGELGNGVTSTTPVMTPPASSVGGTWNHVAIAIDTTCAIRSDHTLWCWGKDHPATPTTMHSVPTRVDLATDWDALAMAQGGIFGELEICAIKTTGTLWCWGTLNDEAGARTVDAPTQIGTATDWKSIALGVARCGIKTGGTLWCWDNEDALGDGGPIVINMQGGITRALAPTQIGTDTDWKAVTTGGPQCGLKTDGSVLCWGRKAKPVADVATTPVAVK